LRGNSRLKSLSLRISSSPEDGNRELLAIAGALKENRGLVDLDLIHEFTMRDETRQAVYDSLKTHPTLEVVDLQSIQFGRPPLAAALLRSRIQVLVDMLKVNMSIHTIILESCQSKHELYRESVIPYLETNRLRSRVSAIQKIRLIMYRAKVLGRALLMYELIPIAFGCF
jgi:hypothetical protein